MRLFPLVEWKHWYLLLAGVLLTSADLHAEKRLGVNIVHLQIPRLMNWESYIGQGAGYVADTLPWDSWQHISGEKADRFFKTYHAFPHKDRLEIGLPLFPAHDHSGKAYSEIEARWEQAADGEFDSHFQTLARTLVQQGFGSSYLRPAWELNGSWFPWGIDKGDPSKRGERAELFAAYWRRVHTAMMSVKGAQFKWLWNVSVGYEPDQFDFTRAWPGDAYVDFVSVDIYDAQGEYYWTLLKDKNNKWPQATLREWAWKSLVDGVHTSLATGEADGQVRGMNFYREFARQKNKGFIISEWGLWDSHVITRLEPRSYAESSIFGSGDNPDFIQRMYDWIKANDVHAAAYFNVWLASEPIDHTLIDDGLGIITHPESHQKFLDSFVAKSFQEGDKLSHSVLFADSFDKPPFSPWRLEGKHIEIKGTDDNKALHIDAQGAPVSLYTPPYTTADTTLSLQLKLTNPWHGVDIVLLRSVSHEYKLRLKTDADGWLQDVVLFADTSEIAKASIPRSKAVLLNYEPALVKITTSQNASGLHIQCRVEDHLILGHVDEKPISNAGRFGIVSSDWTQAEIDNFFVFGN